MSNVDKDLGGAAVRGEAVVDVAEVDKHLDAVLRASGSALHYFSMQKVMGAMRNAMIEAMRSNAVQVSASAADALDSQPTEPAACGACHGSGRMVRDADIGTDQECFSCDGSGESDEASSQPTDGGVRNV